LAKTKKPFNTRTTYLLYRKTKIRIEKVDAKKIIYTSYEIIIIMSEKYTKVCPRCGSKDVRFEATSAGIFDICKKCEFRMNNFPEVKESELENFRKEIKENPIIKE